MTDYVGSEKEILARDILEYAKESILIEFPFLANAVHQMNTQEQMWYQSELILTWYGQEQKFIQHACLHRLLHYCFRQDLLLTTDAENSEKSRSNYMLACDISVAAIIRDIGGQRFRVSKDRERELILAGLEKQLPYLLAPIIYKALENGLLTEEQSGKYRKLFCVDEHSNWRSENKGHEERKQLTRNIKTDLETFSKKHSKKALFLALREAIAEPVDYAAFLRRFTCATEEMKINEEEFDLSYYLYGLSINEKMPFVEPLEYAEEHKIRDFVIAIDTSGSTAGSLVQNFLDKTFTILQATNTFSNLLRLHIVQCDDHVQSDMVVTTKEEMDQYVAKLPMKGFGATNFQPVFTYIDNLIQEQQLRDLRGLLYFTDGRGIYPTQPSSYQTAFIFIDDEDGARNVPPWAVGISLPRTELRKD